MPLNWYFRRRRTLHRPRVQQSPANSALRGLAWLAAALAWLSMPAQAGGPPLFGASWWGQNAQTRVPAPAKAAAQGANIPSGSAVNVAQSIADLTAAARAIAQAQAAQSRANAAALGATSTVPDGLAAAGLQVDPRVATNPAFWQGAALPTQTVAGGRSNVTVQQTQPAALLNWQTFNVGSNTTLNFDQSSGGTSASSWVVLNRVNDPSAQPSRILGSITAAGEVLVLNGNGIIFGAGAQVNVNALIAAATTNLSAVAATSANRQLLADQNLLPSGIYSAQTSNGYTPSFTDAGAGIATLAPIPGVAAGDVDLIAPLGTIDAGEAGIRVSGNANLAALTVVNAANVQVGGHSTGLPTIVAPNVGALNSATAAAAAANQAAQQSASNATGASAARAAGASVISVEVIGFGNCAGGNSQNGCANGATSQ